MNERLAVARRVMRAMRHESGRRPMDDLSAVGVPQVVICVPSDTIAYTCDRVKAVGGRATVVTPHAQGLLPLAWVVDVAPDQLAILPDDGPMHPDSTMAMLLDWWTASSSSAATFRVCIEAGSIEMTEGEQITIPA